MKKLVAGVACAALPLVAVAPVQAEPDAGSPTVTYSHVGPSTAPEYHVEYVITVRGGVATAKVGGYGTVYGTADPAKTETKRLDYATQRALVQNAASLPAPATGTPCPGASTTRLTYRAAGAAPRRTVAYTCAAGDRGDAAAISRYTAPVDTLFTVLPSVTFTVTR
ncbi:hypothetical protein LB823_18125 [Tsukamurella sp. M9C]|uniref:hypothetical protein n=1 Tax=Tsukamurella sp. M9C TaxID=2877520 RepID=UPI001CCDBC8D|nr:hypothetical protein [Tsukamurella sp. M9C]MCA0158117.1 hypothetical protein [Tsukamurella sp. M9C]